MIRFIQLILLAVVLMGPAAAAQEKTGREAPEANETAGSSSVIWRWVNFAALFGLLGYVLRKPAAEFFETRKADISSGLERAKQAQEDSDRRMTQIEQRLGQLSADVAALRVEAEQESAKERDRMIADGQREVERVVEQSKQEMERIALGIERDIKEKIADIVIQRASQKLQVRMTQNDQDKVVVKFIKNL